MLTITEAACKGLHEILKKNKKFLGLRLVVTGGVPGAYQSQFHPVRAGDARSDDIILEQGLFKIHLDPETGEKMKGAVIDLVPTFRGPNFKIEQRQPEWDDPLAARLQKLITDRINPGLASHGGYVALLRAENGTAEIIMGGGCQGCGLSAVTLSLGIANMIKTEIPEIHTVVDKTDHSQGENPYYASAENGEITGSSPLAA